MAETSLERILAALDEHRPRLLVIDSIQVLFSEDSRPPRGACRRCASAPGA
jgi:DNA repair protein RadA/Sms